VTIISPPCTMTSNLPLLHGRPTLGDLPLWTTVSIIAHDAAMPRRERCYRGFIVSWKEPPVSANKWDINVSPEDRGKHGKTQVITGATLQEAWAKARKFIDDLLRPGGNPTQ
jgi:hypothetical protein